jgi:hypothetical protein
VELAWGHVWSNLYGVKCMVYSVQCMVYGVWCMSVQCMK